MWRVYLASAVDQLFNFRRVLALLCCNCSMTPAFLLLVLLGISLMANGFRIHLSSVLNLIFYCLLTPCTVHSPICTSARSTCLISHCSRYSAGHCWDSCKRCASIGSISQLLTPTLLHNHYKSRWAVSRFSLPHCYTSTTSLGEPCHASHSHTANQPLQV